MTSDKSDQLITLRTLTTINVALFFKVSIDEDRRVDFAKLHIDVLFVSFPIRCNHLTELLLLN